MTATGGFVPATRDTGALGVHSIGEFVFAVPDLTVAQSFYDAFGLAVSEAGDGLDLATAGDRYRWGRLIPGRQKRLNHISFNCFEADLDRFKRRVEGLGIQLLDPPPGFAGNGLWFRDPDGILLEIRVGPKTSPDAKPPIETVSTESGVRRAPYRADAARAVPRRLSHLLCFTTDIDRAIQFYGRALGLRLSDRAGDGVAFLHGIHGSDHHLIAFGKSDGPGLHHVSWDVPSLDAVGLGAMTMADKGYARGWGFGRHVLGSNYFHYIRDPWGSYAEYSFDIDFIPAGTDWEGLAHTPENGFYLWGPEVPPDFVTNFETERG
jgi:catechol 2,3-dioxygenase